MNNDNKTTRELAIEWWDKISERAKILSIAVELNIDSKRAYRVWNDCQGQITDAKIVEIYQNQHPTETESKGQEPEVDLLVDAARYFDCKKINIPGIYSGSYIDKIDFFVFADRLTKENKELREALEIIISSPEWIKNYGGGEVDIKAKQALNQ